ncbi:hypothetical protein [Granulicella tundricola]|nr:hypothetical protein [Granulicella tundricola]
MGVDFGGGVVEGAKEDASEGGGGGLGADCGDGDLCCALYGKP